MPTMDDREMLLRAICDPVNFGDDALRLVYADELEEQGDATRATFIRLQCHLAELEAHKHHPLEGQPARVARRCNVCRERKVLRYREEELLGPYAPKMRFGDNEVAWFGNAFLEFVLDKVIWRRGFLHTIACPLAAWLERGRAIVRLHPVEAVTLTDRVPYYSAPLFTGGVSAHVWFDADANGIASHLGAALFAHLRGGYRRNPHAADYATRDAALDALSAAALTWARAD